MNINFSRNFFVLLTIFCAITGIFFYPVIRSGFVPFPGDLLLAEYQPWRSFSFNGYVPGSVPEKAQYFDPLRQMYPWKTFIVNSLKTGNLPFWNPHNFAGTPLLANFQSAILYPLNFFYFIFQQKVAWTLLVMLQPFFCLIVMFVLCRHYKMSYLASIFSGISYAFCLYMTTFLEYNILGHYMYIVPLGILAIEWSIQGKRLAPLFLTLAVTASGFAGHAQLFAGTIVFLSAFILIRSKSHRRLLLFVFCGIAISGIQLIPGLELIALSARSAHPANYFYTNLLIRPEQLILYIIPDLFGNPATRNYLLPFSYPSKALYVGVGTLLLALVSLIYHPKHKEWQSLAIITFITGLFIFLNPVSFLVYRFNLPFFSSSSPSNFIFLLSFGICLLAGFGFDSLRFHSNKKSIFVVIGIWCFVAIDFLLLRIYHTPISTKNVFYSIMILTAVSSLTAVLAFSKKAKTTVCVIFILVTVADLFYFFHKFNPFVPPSYIYPETTITNWLQKNSGINRFWGYGSGAIEANFATQTNIFSPDGYDPLYPKYYGELIQTSKNGKIPKNFTDETRSDAVIASGYGETDMMTNPYRLKILSLMGVKYIIDKTENGSTAKTFPPELFTNVATLNDFHIFEYSKAAARAFLTNSYRIYKSPTEAEHILFDSDFDPTKSIMTTQKPSLDLSAPLQEKEVKITSYTPTAVSIETISDNPAFLYLSDTDYPGWEAKVDNISAKIYRADYAFRAVVVPKGNHTVTFQYRSKSILWGIYLTILGILVTCVLFFFTKPYTKEV